MTTRTHTAQHLRDERGSALTELAILVPIFILLIWWSAALTDVVALRLKAAEATRFALWETTVFRTPQQIDQDVAQRFRDMRSPASINRSDTGMMMYPQAANVVFSAQVNPSARTVGMGGNYQLPPDSSWFDRFLNMLANVLGRAVNTAVRLQRFNVQCAADVRVRMARASHLGSDILTGGNFVGETGGRSLDHTPMMRNLWLEVPTGPSLPMRIVFDTWKAWPRPAQYALAGQPTDVRVDPMQTYPVVEEQVARQVDKIAFFGLNNLPGVGQFNDALSRLVQSGGGQFLFGGRLPNVFSSERMDGPRNGPITIRPVERPNVSWAPGAGLDPARVGDVGSTGVRTLGNDGSLGQGSDRTRYTVPFRINSVYWSDWGGATRDTFGARTRPFKPQLAQNNDYVVAWNCRGHFFAGSRNAQETRRERRYLGRCN
jgi:hypothetical protein